MKIRPGPCVSLLAIALAAAAPGAAAAQPAACTLPAGNAAQQWDEIAQTTVLAAGPFQNEGLIYMAYTTSAMYRAVSPGERMLVLVGKRPDWFGVMLAGLKVGAVTIPCSEMLRAKDLDFRVRHSGAVLLVADPASRGEVEAMSEAPEVVYVGETDLGDPDAATADTTAAAAEGYFTRRGPASEAPGWTAG